MAIGCEDIQPAIEIVIEEKQSKFQQLLTGRSQAFLDCFVGEKQRITLGHIEGIHFIGEIADRDSQGIAIGNFANEMNALYMAQRDSLLFADEAVKEGLGPASQKLLKFGLFFFDYDLDGRLDVLTANGHLEPEINRVEASQQYRQPAQLFWNRGDAKGVGFAPVPEDKCGLALLKPIV